MGFGLLSIKIAYLLYRNNQPKGVLSGWGPDI